MSRVRQRTFPLVLMVAALILGACGGSDSPDEDAAEEGGEATAPESESSEPAEGEAAGEEEAGEETETEPSDGDSGAVPDLPAPEVTAIEFGYSALEPHSFLIEYANQLGLYEEAGFESFETFYMEGTGPASQALVAGQLHGIMSPGGPVLSAAVTGAPFVSVATSIAKMTDSLFGGEGITTADDLRGGSVAISQFGGESHAVVLLALEELGLTDQDVTLVQVGGQSDRVAALLAGSVQAAPIDEAQHDTLVEQGLTELVRLSETDLQLARQGLVFTKEFADANHNTVLAITAGALQALQAMYADPEAAIDGYMEWTQSTDREQAEIAINAYLEAASQDLRWDKSSWEALQVVQIEANPAVADVDVETVYTFEYLDELDALGFSEAVGAPSA